MNQVDDPAELTGESRERYVRAMFDRIATPYDRLNRLISLGRDEAWRREALDMAGVGPGARVVDLGTGTGDLYLQLRERVGPTGAVIGIDLSPNMLEIARRKAELRPEGPAIDLREGNAQTTGLADASVDFATMAWVLRNVGDRRAAYAELRRILRPGGRFVCLDTSRPDFAPARWGSALYCRGVMPVIVLAAGGDMDAYRYLTSSTARFPMRRELENEMRDAGLVNVSSRPFCLGSIAAHVAENPA
ncbi:MAG: ubiquinone/menaquinone biosynthesis methyltransferase [Planctomycetota bacterium]